MNNKKYLVLFLGFIKQNKKIITGIIMLSVIFYWFAWRPAHIRKICAEQATGERNPASIYVGSELWQMNYLGCLKTNGLKD